LTFYVTNFGNVVIESLSVGTAVLIGDNVGLASYVSDNKFGWLCDTNPMSVSNAINSICLQREELTRIQKAAPNKILNDFNSEKLVKKYINMYNQILKHE
jgi:glycosyltransferase involved in cell wall biosynthesis